MWAAKRLYKGELPRSTFSGGWETSTVSHIMLSIAISVWVALKFFELSPTFSFFSNDSEMLGSGAEHFPFLLESFGSVDSS